MHRATSFPLPLLLLLVVACDCGTPPPTRCETRDDCEAGESCIDGRCVQPSDGGVDGDVRPDAESCTEERVCRGGTSCCQEGEECVDGFLCLPVCETLRCGDNGSLCCGAEEICLDGVVCAASCEAGRALCGASLDTCCEEGDVCTNDACVTPGAACEDDFDCLTEGDYCEPTVGRCFAIPDGVDCEVRPDFDRIALEAEWHWPGVTIGGQLYENVIAQPVVGDVSGDGIPDVVVPVYRGSSSTDTILVALHGRTGELLWHIGGADRPDWISSVALANFDPTDEALEIVYRLNSGGLRIVDGDGTTQIARRAAASGALAGRGAPSIADLDADGIPDVVFGCHALNGADIGDATRDFFNLGVCATGGYTLTLVADLDGDGVPEVTSGGVAIRTDGTTLWNRSNLHGLAAVADLDLDGTPEVAVVREGTIVVLEGATGEVLIGPGGSWAAGTFAIPGGGNGGAPTIADFDGDGFPEIATAGRAAYAVYDPDCLPTPPRAGGSCEGGATAFLRWQTATQDISSSITGSSVFDFQGDGVSEVIYNDECFLHVYDGRTGADVLDRIIPNSSRTAIEYPLVVDVDRDGNSEIVVGGNKDQAVSRDGCPAAYAAAFGVPVAELPAAYRSGTSGVFVYGDPGDRWVRTRPIWNQHTYHVTNVGDRGEVPRVEPDNWSTPGLNNYRQNVQGAGVFNAPNLQVELSVVGVCSENAVRLSAVVRNAGSRGVPAGVRVELWRLSPAPEELVGELVTTGPLLPGATERLTLTVSDIPSDTELRFEARVDGTVIEGVEECNLDDNTDQGDELCPGLL